MFVEGFSPAAALASVACPRCHAVGLVEIDGDTYAATPASDKHQATYYIDPSVTARCTACNLAMEWPGCVPD